MIKLYFKEIEDAKTHAEYFTRNILGQYLNADSNSLVICKNEFGKPYLRDYSNTHYNISHTKGAIVCCVSDEPVGIDIERVKKINRRIAERFFTQNEQNYIFDDIENQDERFAEIWTKKEAYVKFLGVGIEKNFESVDVLDQSELFSFTINNYFISICSNEMHKIQSAVKIEVFI